MLGHPNKQTDTQAEITTCYTVLPGTLETSKEFNKCRLLTPLIIKCMQIFISSIEQLY